MRIIQILILSMMCSAASADEWRYQVVPYIWWPNFQAESNGDVTMAPNRNNLVFETETKLDAAFLVYTAATKDRHTFSFEFDWVDVNTGGESNFPLFPSVDIDWELFAYTLGYDYKIIEGLTESDGVSLGIGARYFDLDIEATLKANFIPDITVGVSDTWTDGFVALHGRQTIGDSGKWYVSGRRRRL